MKGLIIRFVAKRTIKYIEYLRKNHIDILQDKNGNVLIISKDQDKFVKCWQERPIAIEHKGKEGIIYKQKYYFLEEPKVKIGQ